MTSDQQNFPVCGNGHRQPVASTKFCIYCGVPIAAAQPPNGNAHVAQNGAANPLPQPQFQHVQQFQQFQYQPVNACRTCGGNGQGLAATAVVCRECKWLRPLVHGYTVDNSAFAWAADAKAMAVLRSMRPLNAAAKAVSEKVGRRWIEVTFNGVLLGEKQMPHIYGQAVRAARILGMERMPDVYISGERPWDCLTFGSDHDSFIVVGSAVAGNFQGVDMLYLLAREIGHCKAGHALWKTVIRFFLGEQGQAKGFMASGVLANILSPTALIGGALEMPLLAWARQAEITADRAGLLAVGSEEIARRALLSWSLKSSFIFRHINIEAWLEQQREDDGDMLRLSELTTTSTPYIGPRLKLLNQFAVSPEFRSSFERIRGIIAASAPPRARSAASDGEKEIKLKCGKCGTAMRVPQAALNGRDRLSVKCPNAKCGKATVIKRNAKAGGNTAVNRQRQENHNYGD